MVAAFHSLELKEVFSSLNANANGLTSEEAQSRLLQSGPNKLQEEKKMQPLKIFFGQFVNVMIIILIAAAIVSGFLGELADAAVILAIVVLNAVLGFVQEYKAEKALEALKKLSAPQAKVLRDGKYQTINSEEIVSGDILVLEQGDSISADCRLIEGFNAEADESTLTGESTTVRKLVGIAEENSAIGDRKNMLFAGTILANGRALALVVATGKNTELGKIATLVSEVEQEKTPLQKELDSVGKFILAVIGAVIATTFLIGLFYNQLPLLEIFLVSISLAVAAIPEGLPAAVTIALAFGSKAMTKRNAITRKLAVVENLGAVNVICTDKTGTLTENQMTVEKIFANNKTIFVSGVGYSPKGEFSYGNKPFDCNKDKAMQKLFLTSVLCNDAQLQQKYETGQWTIFGDPTEGCLLTVAGKANMVKKELETQYKRVDEVPFDAVRKMMSVLAEKNETNKKTKEKIVFTKGALESILPKCASIMVDGKIKKLDQKQKSILLKQQDDYAKDGYRILAFAYRDATIRDNQKTYESKLIFLGLAAMRDPIRPDAYEAVKLCHSAGIRIIMVTGDHMKTAQSIAQKLELDGSSVMEGKDLESLSEDQLDDAVRRINVFARVSPEHKMIIVKTLQKHGLVVAMTGDGVNDAPALKKAEVGIAMGLRGTDVAKESSQLILRDDNFATIVAAIHEGRRIYDNIQKFLRYLFSCNLGEVIAVFLALILKMPLILVAVQILWMNLITDGIPALALSVESAEKDIMQRKPRNSKEPILSKEMKQSMVLIGSYIGLVVLGIYWYVLKILNYSVTEARTIAFATIIFLQLFHAFNCRSLIKSAFSDLRFTSPVVMTVAGSILLQLFIMYLPFTHNLFNITYLPLQELDLALLAGASVIVIEELRKWFLRMKMAKEVV